MSATIAERLSVRLREETRTLHGRAERAGAMRALLQGRLDRAGYVALLRNLHAIYVALEDALAARAALPGFAAFGFAALRRAEAIAADLAVLDAGNDPGALPPPLAPATDAYVARLRQLRDETPALLVAHAYTRYLGDLNGGRLLRKAVMQAYDLRDGQGIAFYDFGDATAIAARIAAFRAALDALPSCAATTAAIVAEARHAFTLHVQLFDEIVSGGR